RHLSLYSPRPPPRSPLFPYTTLFRSEVDIYRKPYVLTPELANASITPATKMLLLIDPNNPLGSGCTRDQVRGLSDIARDHDLWLDRKSTRLNSSHVSISYAVFCLKKK